MTVRAGHRNRRKRSFNSFNPYNRPPSVRSRSEVSANAKRVFGYSVSEPQPCNMQLGWRPYVRTDMFEGRRLMLLL